MSMPALRLLVFIGVQTLVFSLSACSGSSDSDASSAATFKSACGGATTASATMHCPPGFVQPKS